jgi:hypothetical protein
MTPDLKQQAAIILGVGRIDLESPRTMREAPRIYQRTVVSLRLLARGNPCRHAGTVRKQQPSARLRTIRPNGMGSRGI